MARYFKSIEAWEDAAKGAVWIKTPKATIS